MFKHVPVLPSLLATMILVSTVAFGQDQSNSSRNSDSGTRPQSSKPIDTVLAIVNGTPIVEADVRFALNSSGHNKNEVPPAHRTNVLEAIVRRELLRQRAVELGLDANRSYQEKLRRMDARINAFKRKELSDLLWREIAGSAEISEAEVKRYFAENAAQIKTELHVWQILRRREGSIEQDLNDLEQGTSFEEVARKRFSRFPKAGGAPWDLGYLKWNQVPEPWRNVVYDLKKDQMSGIIRGPNQRFWIIKLIDKREDPATTLESSKPTIVAVLKNVKIEELREKTERDLRTKATITYSKGPAGACTE